MSDHYGRLRTWVTCAACLEELQPMRESTLSDSMQHVTIVRCGDLPFSCPRCGAWPLALRVATTSILPEHVVDA